MARAWRPRSAADSVNFDWWNEFLAQTSGVGVSFVPAILGFAAVMKNLSTVADATPLPTVMAIAVSAHMLLSLFLIGGVMDRLARDRAIGAGAFFSACGVYAVRFLRLALIVTAVYWVLFVPYHTWLFDGLYPALTAEVTVERTAFFYRTGIYALFVAPLLFVNLIVDYAKVRAVVEDRRSMIGALVAGWRFVRRHPGAAIGLYALDALLFLLVLGLYFLAAPGANLQRPGVRRRAVLHRVAGDRAAAVCRIADRVVPGPLGARRLRSAASADVAGFARGRGARARATDWHRLDADWLAV